MRGVIPETTHVKFKGHFYLFLHVAVQLGNYQSYLTWETTCQRQPRSSVRFVPTLNFLKEAKERGRD